MKRLALLTAAALVLTGCSSAPKNADGDSTVAATVDGQDLRLDLPSGPTKGLAVWFHGQGGDANTRMNEPWLNTLRTEGWAVASSDFSGNAWGAASAITDTQALLNWAREKTGNPDKTLFITGSMGALNSLTYMASTGDHPGCWYGTMPVVDVSTVANVPDAEDQIETAHEGPPAVLDLTRLPEGKYRILFSPADTWVPAATNAEILARAVRGDVSSLEVSGEHGHLSHFDEADLVEFAAECSA